MNYKYYSASLIFVGPGDLHIIYINMKKFKSLAMDQMHFLPNLVTFVEVDKWIIMICKIIWVCKDLKQPKVCV